MADLWSVEAVACRELEEETFRERVEERKAYLRERRMRPWWVRLFPFRIRLERL